MIINLQYVLNFTSVLRVTNFRDILVKIHASHCKRVSHDKIIIYAHRKLGLKSESNAGLLSNDASLVGL